jgi:hypothetical protein
MITSALLRARAEKAEREANEWRARAEKAEATVNAIHTAQRYSPTIVLDSDIPIVSCAPDLRGNWLRRSDLLPADE